MNIINDFNAKQSASHCNNTAIRHITLTTGHVRDSLSDEISQIALAYFTQLIHDLNKSNTHVDLSPYFPGYTINGAIEGNNLIATVWCDYLPVVTIGVAAFSHEGRRLWEVMHQDQSWSTQTKSDQKPSLPWCAAKLQPGLMLYPEASEWLGDFERCLAWAFINIRNSSSAVTGN